MSKVKTSTTKKKTTGYLEFYRHEFKKYNNNPANKLHKISVPYAGQKFGQEWKAMSLEQQQHWNKKAEKLNSKRNVSAKKPNKHSTKNPVSRPTTRSSTKHAIVK